MSAYYKDSKTGKWVRSGGTGPQGPKGDTGATGPQGPKGETGDPGKTAYAYAQDGGYTGSEEEFAALLAKGGADEVVISSEKPTDENVKVWINPDEGGSGNVSSGNDPATYYKDPDTGEWVRTPGGGSGGAQPDWNAAEGELGHVKNRTHWVEYGDEVIIVPETTLTTTEDSAGNFYIEAAIPVEVGKTYTIVYNGTAYSCTAVDGAVVAPEAAGLVIFGNYGFLSGTGDTGEPFVILTMPGEGAQLISLDGATSVTISVSDNGEIVHKLDKKYLPDDIGGGGIFTVTVSDDESGNCTADKSLAEMASAYMAGKVLQCMYNETILHLHTAQPAVGVYAFTGAITANQMDKRIIMFAEGSIYMFTADATVPEIPTKLPNPYAVFFYRALGGTATSIKNATYGTHKSDGSSALRIHGIANPYALTINGTKYDGSSAKDLTDVINAMIDTKLSSLTSAEEVAF